MPKIHITRPHSLSLDEAKKRVHHLAQEIQKKFPSLISSIQWNSSQQSAKIAGTGFDGNFDINEKQLSIALNLSFLATPFRSKIESQLHSGIDEHFGTP